MIVLNMLIGGMEIGIGISVLIAVIAIEAIVIGKRLSNKWINFPILITIIFSNIVSTFIGLVSLAWIWNLIEKATKSILNLPQDYTSYYFGIGFVLITFLLTLIIEILFNLLNLKSYNNRAVIISTLFANALTYFLIGLLILTTALYYKDKIQTIKTVNEVSTTTSLPTSQFLFLFHR